METLEKHKGAINQGKQKLEGLYSKFSQVKDKDLPEDALGRFNEAIGLAEAAVTDYLGALKPIKLLIEAKLTFLPAILFVLGILECCS